MTPPTPADRTWVRPINVLIDRVNGRRGAPASGESRPAGPSRPGDDVGVRIWIPTSRPPAAEFQVPRLARERGLSEDPGPADHSTSTPRGRQLGFLGEPRVNVLEVNLALDEQKPMARK